MRSKKINLIYHAGAGGEFLLLLLLSHKSALWNSVPLCCYLPAYDEIRSYLEKNDRIGRFDTSHNLKFYNENDINIRINIKDLKYLEKLKRRKLKGKLKHASLEDIDSITPDLEIDYFNPYLSYSKLCEMLKLEPDYTWFCRSYKYYFALQKVYFNCPSINNAIKTLNGELLNENKTSRV